MEFVQTIFQIIVLLFSVIIHEISHGYVAEKLGDPTARLAGRLTLNPLKHLDPFGSVILPALLILSHAGFVFGWAKPVPYNPWHLKKPERDGALIALAGPLSNLLVAVIFSLIFRLSVLIGSLTLGNLCALIVLINVALAIFNLVPIPPLDGSKILFLILGRRGENVKVLLEQYGIFILAFFIIFGFQIIVPAVIFIFRILTGVDIY